MRIRQNHEHRNKSRTRRKIRLIYARPGWHLTSTAPRYKYFASLEEALGYVRKLQAWKRAMPGLEARLDELDPRTHHYRELPEGWQK